MKRVIKKNKAIEHNDYKVSISKEFNAPVEKLYKAWTQEEPLKQWWKPMNKTLTEVVNNLHKDGDVRYVFEDNSLIIEGKYMEVKENEKLVYSWNWQLAKDDIKDSSYKLTIEFSGKDDISNITVLQENFESEEGALPHKEGWEKGLNDLKEFLEATAK